MDTTIKKTPFKFDMDKQQMSLIAISILSFGLLLFILLYRSAKRRADELEEENDALHTKLVGEEPLDASHIELPQPKAIQEEVQSTLNQIRVYNNQLKKERDSWMNTAVFLSKLQERASIKAEEEQDISEEKEVWERAKKINTLEAYADFLEQEFETSRYKSVAKRIFNKLQAAQNKEA